MHTSVIDCSLSAAKGQEFFLGGGVKMSLSTQFLTAERKSNQFLYLICIDRHFKSFFFNSKNVHQMAQLKNQPRNPTLGGVFLKIGKGGR